MRCLKLPVVVAALLCVLANAQCVARCMVVPCDRSEPSSADLPPCHRHQSQIPAPKPCTSTVFVVDGRVHSVAQEVYGFVAVVELVAPTAWRPAGQPHPSPPRCNSGGPSFHILRI